MSKKGERVAQRGNRVLFSFSFQLPNGKWAVYSFCQFFIMFGKFADLKIAAV